MVAALVLQSLLLVTSPVPTGAPPPDVEALMKKAREVQVADTAAWATFRFRREALREELDESGAVVSTELLVSRITPVPGGFDEELLEIDGRKPTPREVESHRHAGPFQKHYHTMLAGDREEGGGEGYSLGDLLRMSDYRYGAEEMVDGIRCHRLEFAPDPEKKGSGLAGRFANAMAGTLWITVEGLHLFRARARTLQPISIALSLAKVHELSLEMGSGPEDGGVWLARRIALETHSRVLFKTTWRRIHYRYSDFVPAGENRSP